MKCNIKVVSPVHIGSGDGYGASEYLPVTVSNKKKEKINTFKRIDISSYYLSLDDTKKDEFISNLSNPKFSLKSFDTKIPNTFRKYIAIDKCGDKHSSQQIEETIKTLNKAYIPGSSIKGAIKTAILYHGFDYHYEQINNFNVYKFINKFFTSKGPSAQKDIMKFLQVSDTNDVKQISIYDILTIMASEYGNRKSFNYYKRNKKSNNPTLSYYETIDSGNQLEFTINNNYNEQVHSKLNLDDKLYLININNIKKSLYTFSKDYINHEIEFSKEYGMNSLNRFYRNISKLNTKDTPLLKIGAGSGLLATTLVMKIKEHVPRLYEEIMEKKGGYEYCFPKSRKITKFNGRPLGWIQLNFER